MTRTMKDLGFKQGRASPCAHWQRQRDVKALVHGDDFVSSRERSELERLCRSLQKKFETKMKMTGEYDELVEKARLLHRIASWHPHIRREMISRETGAGKLKTISPLAAKETGRETEEEKRQDLDERRLSGQLGCKLDNDNNDTLSSDEVTRFRRIAARANFQAQDRVDIAFSTEERTRRVTAPTKDDWNKLFRLGRYLARCPRVVNWYKYQYESDQVVACTDSKTTRRSTSGGCIHKGQHTLNAQAVVALSLAEAELGAAVMEVK